MIQETGVIGLFGVRNREFDSFSVQFYIQFLSWPSTFPCWDWPYFCLCYFPILETPLLCSMLELEAHQGC